ncbi:D-alanyl-D-alanine carboxypeptidase family protein [Nonomuraea sp. NPDC050310]|uniref:D-alanyl-D-alanine carboxypeptidase family protein n=1 Tax=unclassified Nonomuraea TaxID=2593643 RepID=UPI0033E8E8FC
MNLHRNPLPAVLALGLVLLLTACEAISHASADPTTGLTAGTRAAYLKAAKAAKAAGFELRITSGYRTPDQQRAEFREAVGRYGSAEEAAKYVLPPEKSAHVKGTALDLGPEPAARWLEQTAGRYRLCRIYANEWWHFEYRPSKRCPRLLPDGTHAR